MTTKPKTKTRKIKPIVSIPPIIADDISISVNPELPKTMPMIDVLREEAAKSETVCEKARRLAREEREREQQRALVLKQAFLNQFDLVAQLEDDYVYELCGYQWYCGTNIWYQRNPKEYYLSFVNPHSYGYWMVTDLISLGRVVLAADEAKVKANLAAVQATLSAPWWKRAWRYLFS